MNQTYSKKRQHSSRSTRDDWLSNSRRKRVAQTFVTDLYHFLQSILAFKDSPTSTELFGIPVTPYKTLLRVSQFYFYGYDAHQRIERSRRRRSRAADDRWGIALQRRTIWCMLMKPISITQVMVPKRGGANHQAFSESKFEWEWENLENWSLG